MLHNTEHVIDPIVKFQPINSMVIYRMVVIWTPDNNVVLGQQLGLDTESCGGEGAEG
jgi:hypothetical protein